MTKLKFNDFASLYVHNLTTIRKKILVFIIMGNVLLIAVEK